MGKVVLNGTENWINHSYGTNSFSLQNIINTTFNANNIQVLTDKFKGVSNANRTSGDNIVYTISNTEFVIRNTTFTSLSNFKTWLGSNPMTLYYQLANPTTETITNSNLISQLNNLYEFYVQSSTVSISNNSEIPLEVLLEYYGR